LIGAPKAQDQIEQFGELVLDYQKEIEEERGQMRAAGRIVPVVG
jgi:DNA repair protein RAD7